MDQEKGGGGGGGGVMEGEGGGDIPIPHKMLYINVLGCLGKKRLIESLCLSVSVVLPFT